MRPRHALRLLPIALAVMLAGCDDVSEPAAPLTDALPDMTEALPDASGDMADATSGDASTTPDATPDAIPDAMPDVIDGIPDASSDATPCASDPESCGPCPLIEPAPVRTLFVAPDGDDDAGDGSRDRPYGSLAHAADRATPGTEVRLLPGAYPGGILLTDVHGTPEAPIVIGGDPSGAQSPVIDAAGEAEGLHLIRPRWLVLRNLTVRGARDNGINVDDGGAYGDPDAARYVVFRDLVVEDIGPAGNRDCLKLSGLDDFEVLDSLFRRCGDGGSGIDMVGCHDGLIRGNLLEELGSSGIQAKGGTARVRIEANRFVDAGARPINMGGSIGFEFFRPPLDPDGPNAEARHIEVVSNLIIRGEVAAAFVGCVDCLFAHNTVIEPGRWLLRILQETTSTAEYAFEPAQGGWVTGNIFAFRRDGVRSAVNVGPNTNAESFRFTHDLYYAVDAPERSAPELPSAPESAIVGEDPGLDGDYRLPPDGSAVGAGDPAAGPVLSADLEGGCYGAPPSLGALEAADRAQRQP